MKKTIIALLALGGVAAAADVTIGSYVVDNDVSYDIVETYAGNTHDTAHGLTFDRLHFGTLEFTLNTSDMLVSGATVNTGTILTLDSLTILGRTDDDYKGEASTMSVTLNNATYTSAISSYNDGGSGHATVTYTFDDGITFSLGDDLTFALNRGSVEGADKPYNLGVAAIKGATGAPAVFGEWQMAAQISATVPASPSIPEPTTATLSLLALAGLAARRRRK